MATLTLPKPFLSILTICIFLFFVLNQATAEIEGGLEDELSITHKHIPHKKQMKEILSNFTLYWHDVVTRTNPTVVTIVQPVNNKTGFGSVYMMDDPLTLRPHLGSKLIGRAQGFYGVTSQKDEFSLLMAMNFVFTDGSKYNGSIITIMGRDAVGDKVREMPVIGGSGLFDLPVAMFRP